MNSYAFKIGNSDVELKDLPKDLKRVLKIQFREFIHFVEDAQELSYRKAHEQQETRTAA
jgi:hypothetical protein